MTATEQFSEFVRGHATTAGYDLSGPRSGGMKALAHDTGMSHPTVSRMLNGHTIPIPEFFESIADAIGVKTGHLFELAGIVSPGVLTADNPPEPKPLTAQQAATRLGIRDPLRVALFAAMTDTLLGEQVTP